MISTTTLPFQRTAPPLDERASLAQPPPPRPTVNSPLLPSWLMALSTTKLLFSGHPTEPPYPISTSPAQWLTFVEKAQTELTTLHNRLKTTNEGIAIFQTYQTLFEDTLTPAYDSWLRHLESSPVYNDFRHDISPAITVLHGTLSYGNEWYIQDKSPQTIETHYYQMLSTYLNIWQAFLWLEQNGTTDQVPPQRILDLAISTQTEPDRVKLAPIDEDTQRVLSSFLRQSTLSPTKLFFTWRNLIQNALKYSPNDAPVQVDIQVMPPSDNTKNHTALQFTVTDTGMGIPAEEIETVLAGQRASNAVASDIPGTGFGLATIAKAIQRVQYAGASLDIQSQLNQGTTVTVTTPLSPMVFPCPEEELLQFIDHVDAKITQAHPLITEPAQWKSWYLDQMVLPFMNALEDWGHEFFQVYPQSYYPDLVDHEMRDILHRPLSKHFGLGMNPKPLDEIHLDTVVEDTHQALQDAKQILQTIVAFQKPEDNVGEIISTKEVLDRTFASFDNLSITSPQGKKLTPILQDPETRFYPISATDSYFMLHTLLGNAYKYSEGKPVNVILSLSTLNQTPALQIDIIDEGPGIPEEKKPHLFDGTLEGSYGLKGCQRIIELQKALKNPTPTLTFTSPANPDAPLSNPPGTRATLTLPLDIEPHHGLDEAP